MTTLKVIERNPDHLIPYDRNAMKHPEKQVEELAQLIKRIGFNVPILIDENDVIIAGHGRLLAAERLGMETVPTICIDHLSEREKRSFILADNRIARNGSWDFEKLAEELSDLSLLDVDLVSLGFNEQELDAMLKDDVSILPPDNHVVDIVGHKRNVGAKPTKETKELVLDFTASQMKLVKRFLLKHGETYEAGLLSLANSK